MHHRMIILLVITTACSRVGMQSQMPKFVTYKAAHHACHGAKVLWDDCMQLAAPLHLISIDM